MPSQTVTVTVKPVNDDPELEGTEDIKCIAKEDTACSFDLTSFVKDRDGDPLEVAGPFSASHGIVQVVEGTPGGLELRYTPHLNFNGNDNFTAHVTDGEGGALEVIVRPLGLTSPNFVSFHSAASDVTKLAFCMQVLLKVTIIPVNDAPENVEPQAFFLFH